MSDLTAVIEMQKGTVEALRRRVAELEEELSEEREGSKKAVAEIAKMHKWADKVIAENAELKASFDLYAQAAERGRKLYQESTGDDSEWPDMGHLICWLMERIDELQGDKDAASSEVEILEECNDENIATVLRLGDENAELKRQVEALREATSDLVDNLQAVVNVCRQEPAMNHHRYDSLGVSALKAVDHGRTALREAAKGEVE